MRQSTRKKRVGDTQMAKAKPKARAKSPKRKGDYERVRLTCAEIESLQEMAGFPDMATEMLIQKLEAMYEDARDDEDYN